MGTKIELMLDKENVSVAIRMTAVRTYGDVVVGYYEVNYFAPVVGVKTEGYELRVSPWEEKNLTLYHNGKEVKTFTNGHKNICGGKFSLDFSSKEQASAAAKKMRENKGLFIQMYNEKKFDMGKIKELVF